MGPARHPGFLDVDAMERVRAAFYEIMDALQGQDVFRPAVSDEELRAKIIQKLLELAKDGTPAQNWTSKVISSLPFR